MILITKQQVVKRIFYWAGHRSQHWVDAGLYFRTCTVNHLNVLLDFADAKALIVFQHRLATNTDYSSLP
jgi:hypothetical protein